MLDWYLSPRYPVSIAESFITMIAKKFTIVSPLWYANDIYLSNLSPQALSWLAWMPAWCGIPILKWVIIGFPRTWWDSSPNGSTSSKTLPPFSLITDFSDIWRSLPSPLCGSWVGRRLCLHESKPLPTPSWGWPSFRWLYRLTGYLIVSLSDCWNHCTFANLILELKKNCINL